MDWTEEIERLFSEGYNCSQIMVLLPMMLRGRENPELVRAAAGLGMGLYAEKICGIVTGGCCLLASYGMEHSDNGNRDSYQAWTSAYTAWFEETFGTVQCPELISGERKNIPLVCPQMLEQAFVRCMEILEENGVDICEEGEEERVDYGK